ncbi:S8 family serine peptidase [Mangrovibacillus cuniculi]|uniref:S8 family serine peptidase n=1 Tax=Mangrovibacillus cuniculi TaxID=2593652 RepID=A0A7S8C9H1_9BACI|nr:S8 family serine peptidase [Mangrovibacillus cuniculi]QPC45839.1 S8 family serine peptidase [Mangrovibacillus cuniculi]
MNKKWKLFTASAMGVAVVASTMAQTPGVSNAGQGELEFVGVEDGVAVSGERAYGSKAQFLVEKELNKVPKGILKKLEKVPADNNLFILQLDGPVTEEKKTELEAQGVELLEYIPAYAYVARVTGDHTAVKNIAHVTDVKPYAPLYKIDPALLNKANLKQIKAQVKKLRGETEEFEGKNLDAIIEYLSRNDVLFVEEKPTFTLANTEAHKITKTTVANTTYGLQGSGQVVAVADTGLDTGRNDSSMHESFRGKISALYAWGRTNNSNDPNGHGTHVAGSVLGNASHKGSAPQASLVFQSIMDANGGLGGLPSNLANLFNQAKTAGATIHTNSWGAPVNGAYTTNSQQVDSYVYNNDMTILFAAGNEGSGAGTISSPGTAKNAITVGASENYRPSFGSYADNSSDIAVFSSRGPTKDNRIKPDIVAPGTFILSSRSSLAPDSSFWANFDSKYAYMGGTSMATPLTAGNVALLRENFQKNYGVTPKPSLLKAALIAGATDLGKSRFDQGFGRVDMSKSLNLSFVNEDRNLSTGQKASYTFSATAGKPLNFTLVWTDAPGSTSATYSLVNDLDIVVTAPNGTQYVGNDTSAPFNNNWDGVNNVETVKIAAPQSGTYTIEVQAYNVPSGTQDFSLAIVNN